jgi:hypothetical protein
LLPKLGSSNLQEQTLALEQVLPLFKKYKVIVLGDGVPPSPVLREFCSVDARILPQDNGCIFLFKAEKNHCLETENLIGQRLDQLGVMLWNFIFSRSEGQKNTTSIRV